MQLPLKNLPRPIPGQLCTLIGMILSLYVAPAFAAEDVLQFRLSPQPFSSSMCKKIRPLDDVRIKIANHRDLVIQIVNNQFIPADREEARKKSYIRSVTLEDLTNGAIARGNIAFSEEHAIIFTAEHPRGLSRKTFLDQLPVQQKELANQALNTFLRLHKVLNAALDACRPYPSKVMYGTDDEIDKIQAGKSRYRDLANAYNRNQLSHHNFLRHEPGKSGGFVDPALNGKQVSYHAINPLVFYQP